MPAISDFRELMYINISQHLLLRQLLYLAVLSRPMCWSMVIPVRSEPKQSNAQWHGGCVQPVSFAVTIYFQIHIFDIRPHHILQLARGHNSVLLQKSEEYS